MHILGDSHSMREGMQYIIFRGYLFIFTELDCTGLTFDPKILNRNCHFALVGSLGMLSCPFSDQEDTYRVTGSL